MLPCSSLFFSSEVFTFQLSFKNSSFYLTIIFTDTQTGYMYFLKFCLEISKFFLKLASWRCFQTFLVIFIKVTSIALFTLGCEWRFDLLFVDRDPVCGSEPLVTLNIVDAIL